MEQFLSHILYTLVSWWNAVPGFDKLFLGMPPGSLSISAVFSGAGAAILCKFTGNIGFATMPMNYLALLVGAIAGNWALADVKLPMDQTLQTPIVFALAGMTIAALSMMWLVRRE